MRESHLRSILKAITWRVVATATTFTLAYFIFHGAGCENVLQKSSIVAGLELFLKIALYYFHERAWAALPVGTIRRVFGLKH